jgi:uncharacterized Fe-S cluster protein YjdI
MLNLTWDENRCCHAGICVRSLPAVFRIENGKFKIDPRAAEPEAILEVVAKCPSGALQVQESSA